jgi:signal transduction histidine kinase
MTIKRRLFISNILMIALPVVLTGIMFLLTVFAYFGLTDAQPGDSGSGRGGYYLLGLPILVIAVYFTNRELTRRLWGNIITPMDILINGVHEIRDGNLTYRIHYENKDEFAAVCADFNEMADRLSDMVNARQRDEANRRELIAGISHDLCTPLTAINTYVEGIELGMASTPEKLSHYLATIKSKASDMNHIINQLFLFSKLEVGEFPMQMDEVDMGQWLSDYINTVSNEYEQKGLHIDLVENVRAVTVCVDNVQLRNVLSNVLENAVKHGGKEDAIVCVSCKSNNGSVTITLTDNGHGVPEDNLKNLFEIFYKGDKARTNTSQNSGLGLAISAKIILGGTIHAANSPEGGLSILITLPTSGGAA